MYLQDCFVWAFEHYNLSGIKLFCDPDSRAEVAKAFMECFGVEWAKALDEVEEEYGDCENKAEGYGVPAWTAFKDYGVLVEIGALDIRYCGGDFCDLNYGSEALNATLKAIKEKFPALEYEGLIAYPWSDRRCGDTVQYTLSSKGEELSDEQMLAFVGEGLRAVLEDKEIGEWSEAVEGACDFWDELYYSLEDGEQEDFEDILQTLYACSPWLEKHLLDKAVRSIIAMANAVDEELTEGLQALVEQLENE